MYNILGIGNAICDILVKIDDNILNQLNLEKGSMILCDMDRSTEILSFLREKNYSFTICSGGSAANTIYYLNQYNLNTAFLGNIADDFYGNKFSEDLEKHNIKFYNMSYNTAPETARSIILVTPDGERTMCTSLGCAANANLENIAIEDLTNSESIYIEGYLWDSPETIAEISKIIIKAKSLNRKIIFTLSDAFCVARNYDKFVKLVTNDVDILFANEAEACSFFQHDILNEANLKSIQSNLSEIKPNHIIITRHDKGCIVITESDILHIATEAQQALDTTGAGDSFAAGFLYGILSDFDLTTAAQIANHIAGQVVTKIGARPEVNLISAPEAVPQYGEA